MNFPTTLWPDGADRELIEQMLALFSNEPLVLFDRLTNSVYFNEAAEELFGARADAIVNRSAYSLLGFGESDKAPAALAAALLGEGPPWRGATRLRGEDDGATAFCEASAIVRDGAHVAGVLRFKPLAENAT